MQLWKSVWHELQHFSCSKQVDRHHLEALLHRKLEWFSTSIAHHSLEWLSHQEGQETCGALAESIAFLRPALDEIQLSRCVQQLSHEYGVLLWDQISFVPNTHCTCQALWKEAEVS